MENWQTFLLVNVVMVIVLGIITNLITPWVKSTYERSIFSSKRKRVKRLIEDYLNTKSYTKDYPLFIVYLIRHIAVIILITMFLVSYPGLIMLENYYKDIMPSFFYHKFGNPVISGWVVNVSYTAFYAWGVVEFIVMVRRISDVWDWDNYKEKTINRLKKLGVPQEYLDKLDTMSEENKEDSVQVKEEKKARKAPSRK